MPADRSLRAEYGKAGVPEKLVSTASRFELRSAPNGTGGTDLVFTGYASVTD